MTERVEPRNSSSVVILLARADELARAAIENDEQAVRAEARLLAREAGLLATSYPLRLGARTAGTAVL